jgi:hypothetical protein
VRLEIEPQHLLVLALRPQHLEAHLPGRVVPREALVHGEALPVLTQCRQQLRVHLLLVVVAGGGVRVVLVLEVGGPAAVDGGLWFG